MLKVKSKSEVSLRYIFESDVSPLTSDQFTQGIDGIQGKLEATLELDSGGPPNEVAPYETLKKIIRDCADPDLRSAYDDNYARMMGYLKLNGVEGAKYRVHSVRV